MIGEERRARWENNPMGRFTYDYLLQALDNPYRRPVIGEPACVAAVVPLFCVLEGSGNCLQEQYSGGVCSAWLKLLVTQMPANC